MSADRFYADESGIIRERAVASAWMAAWKKLDAAAPPSYTPATSPSARMADTDNLGDTAGSPPPAAGPASHPGSTKAKMDETKAPPGATAPPLTLSDDCLIVPGREGPRAYYAMRDVEGGQWSGPAASIADALREYLDEHDPADDDPIEVTLGKPLACPRIAGWRLAGYLRDAAGDEDYWPEDDPMDLDDAAEIALEEAVHAVIAAFFAARGTLAGFWRAYGRTVETTAGEARAWLEARPT